MKISKCLLENITNHDLLYKKRSKKVVTNPLALGAIKYLYQFSKIPENDKFFIEEKVFETLYSTLIAIISEDSYNSIDLPYDFFLFLLGILKNISNSSEIGKLLVKLVSPLSTLLPTPWVDTKPKVNFKHSNLLVQVTGILSNLSNKDTFEVFLEYKIIEKLILTVKIYNDQEIALNSLKAISKLSLEEITCDILKNSVLDLFNLINYYESPMILSRACYILANVISVHKTTLMLSEKPSEKIFTSLCNKYFGSFEPVHVDLLIKILRVCANLASATNIGCYYESPEEFLNLLIEILRKYDIVDYEELILNSVACITNLLYFDDPCKSFISNTARLTVFSKLSGLITDTSNEEITVEVLRAFGNLTRHEIICRELPSLFMIDILIMMTDHSN